MAVAFSSAEVSGAHPWWAAEAAAEQPGEHLARLVDGRVGAVGTVVGEDWG